MARRSKTKVGGGPDVRPMLQAGSRGRASQEKAEGQQLEAIQQGGDRVAGAISGAMGGISSGIKNREARQAQAGQQEFENKMTIRGAELDEAKSGFTREPEGQQPGAAPGGAAKTPEEQANLQAQGEKPVEIQGQGPSTSGSQDPLRRSDTGKAQDKAKAYSAQTSRMNAETNRINAERNHASAKARGDVQGMATAIKSMQSGMDVTRKQIDAIVRGDVPPQAVLQAYSDNPDAVQALESEDPAQMALTAKRITESQLAYQNISYMASTGLPPIDRMDSSPIWQRYAQNEIALTAAFRNGMPLNSPNQAFQGAMGEQMPSALAAWQGIQSTEEGNQFIRRLAAKTMLRINEADRMAEQQALATKQTEEMTSLTSENAALKTQIEQMSGALATTGSTELGAPVPKTQETLPGGQQVESGMDARRQQYQPPEESRKSRNPGTTSYKSSYVK